MFFLLATILRLLRLAYFRLKIPILLRLILYILSLVKVNLVPKIILRF
jgi:hypothetical protein